ncbi:MULTISPECIES: hypothetical protein [unclassified Plantibacter]|uniref:DUF6903 family protein n=1 Tax=unclassified Plantibacter TaxID=2624265 RepID=UPI000ADB167A|nr:MULTISPECIES: hypothetical protein [unclassified Plantibacter]
MTKERVGAVVAAVVFVSCVAAVIIANQSVGWLNLGVMLLGLAGLITLLALYNRKFR